jgi:hypothetical protein
MSGEKSMNIDAEKPKRQSGNLAGPLGDNERWLDTFYGSSFNSVFADYILRYV